jgi:hypothetical protein
MESKPLKFRLDRLSVEFFEFATLADFSPPTQIPPEGAENTAATLKTPQQPASFRL